MYSDNFNVDAIQDVGVAVRVVNGGSGPDP
jgi:hypothetical protein